MAEARMINRRIAKSNKLAGLKHERSKVIWFMIYPFLDVEGRYSGDPQDIKEDCCPRQPYSIKQIAESIVELHNIGLLYLYEAKGSPWIEYTLFDEFQPGIRPDREAPSKVPPYSGLTPEQARITPALYLYLYLSLSLIYPSSKSPRIQKIGQAKTPKEKTDENKEFDQFWSAYPKRVAKQDALKAFASLRKTVPLEEIASATNGYNVVIKREQTEMKYIMYPATFLRNEKWKDYVGVVYKPPL